MKVTIEITKEGWKTTAHIDGKEYTETAVRTDGLDRLRMEFGDPDLDDVEDDRLLSSIEEAEESLRVISYALEVMEGGDDA